MARDFDLLIRGATVVTATDSFAADVAVRDGRIVMIGEALTSAERIVDASGLLLLPGAIDSHVHLDQPTPAGITFADGFESGTRAAAAGGTTCVLPFVMQPKGGSLREAVRDYHAKAEGACHVDVSFHLAVTDAGRNVCGQELPALIRDGYVSLKVFMTYEDLKLSDREMLDVLAVSRREGAFVMVHAENDDVIRFLTEELEAAGRTAPYYHAMSRPPVAEREATHRAISFAETIGVPMMIVHVSTREAMEQIRWAQGRGLKIHAETCPQYLVLTADDLNGLNMEGARYVCSPPPRDRDSQEACWEGIVSGTVQTFSSDHCPFFYEGSNGKQNPKARTSFRWVPNGIPGIETRLPILFSEGVSAGRIDVNRFVALTATNHARLFGLYPRKGTIAVGSDADFTVWDPNRREVIRQAGLHHGADYTPYEGFAVTGWPVMTFVRGKLVAEEGRILGDPLHGKYVSRSFDRRAST